MDKSTKNYRARGREQARRLFPISEGYLCEECHDEPATDHHHIDGNPWNNVRENIMLVCVGCHNRIEHKNGRLRHSKLTSDQIKMVREPGASLTKFAQDWGVTRRFLTGIRSGEWDPVPADKFDEGPQVPNGYKAPGMGSVPKLSVAQVRAIRSVESFDAKAIRRFVEEYGVHRETVRKARKKLGAYADSVFEKPVQTIFEFMRQPRFERGGIVYETQDAATGRRE